MFVKETFVNDTRGYQFGDSGWVEVGDDLTRADIYRRSLAEYGRCTSKVYSERKGGPDIPVGWVFEKRMRYEDARGNGPDSYYVQHVWVTVADRVETDREKVIYCEDAE